MAVLCWDDFTSGSFARSAEETWPPCRIRDAAELDCWRALHPKADTESSDNPQRSLCSYRGTPPVQQGVWLKVPKDGSR